MCGWECKVADGSSRGLLGHVPWALLGSLVACQQGANLMVQQTGGVVWVTAARLQGTKPACVSDIAVYRGKPDGARPMWHIVAAPEAACTTKLKLGNTPPGFATDDGMAAPRFEAGQTYRVEVSGNGFLGATDFTAQRSS